MAQQRGGVVGTGRRAAIALVLLALGTGAADAFAFSSLGGIFVANMNGNLVFTTLLSRQGYGPAAVGALLALATWAVATLAGFRVTRDGRDGRVFAAAIVIQLVVVAGWAVQRPPVPVGVRLADVALATAVTALQTVLTARLLGRTRVQTTYLTGTLTDLMRGLADGDRTDRLLRLLVVLALPVGVLLAVGASRILPALEPLVPALTLVGALIAVSGLGPPARSAAE
ncbi:YoaK family protein [Amnibacterium endophyticum]|uniref:YoaK family protein n=1 Tax=Amnibacterium endophyticum TaxID=2109337 RepID=A0ABW4LEM1_9MICO